MSIERSSLNKSGPYTQSLLIIGQVHGPPNIFRCPYIVAYDPDFTLLFSRTFRENIGSLFREKKRKAASLDYLMHKSPFTDHRPHLRAVIAITALSVPQIMYLRTWIANFIRDLSGPFHTDRWRVPLALPYISWTRSGGEFG